jgi:hypothetical protein
MGGISRSWYGDVSKQWQVRSIFPDLRRLAGRASASDARPFPLSVVAPSRPYLWSRPGPESVGRPSRSAEGFVQQVFRTGGPFRF